jgi:hypothetical protein
MDATTACNAIALSGGIYGLQMCLLPSTYLSLDNTPINNDTEDLCRSTGCGILGLTSLAYMAAKSDSTEAKKIALCSCATSFMAWTAARGYRCTQKESTQAKLDTAVTVILFGACYVGLTNNK